MGVYRGGAMGTESPLENQQLHGFQWGFSHLNPTQENKPPEMEFKEFEPRFKSAKIRFKLSAGLNLETFDTILSGANHI